MQSWQMREAKTKLSELVTLAREVGPQAITRRGKPVAVLVSIDAFKLLSHQGESLAAFMQRSPLRGLDELDLTRNPGPTRNGAN